MIIALATVVSEESAGTAGLVAIAVILAGIVRDLVRAWISKRNGKKNCNPNQNHAITKAEILQRDKTRERVAQLHQWANEERDYRKEQTRHLTTLVAIGRSQQEATARIERRQEEAARRRSRGTGP